MDESELADKVRSKTRTKANEHLEQYRNAAGSVPFELEIEPVVNRLNQLAEQPLQATVDPEVLEEAVQDVESTVEREFESMGAEPESGLLPRDYLVVRPAKNARTTREALDGPGLTTRQDLEERAKAVINERDAGPKKYSYACAEQVYSGDYDEPRVVVDNFSTVPIEETYMVIGEGYHDGNDFQSMVLENPPWRELAVVANKLVKVTGAAPDCYLEGIYLSDDAEDETDDVPVAKFFLGS